MSRKAKDATKMALFDLMERCRPFIDSVLADDQRHERESLANRVEQFLRDDDALRAYGRGIISRLIVDEFVRRTSDKPLDRRQMELFNSEAEVREFLHHTTFEVGDGRVIRQSGVVFDDLERRHARMERNRLAVSVACEEDATMLAMLKPYMVDQGMTHEEANVAVWHDLHGM
ncbi:hypothetical protein [Burkholderia territorii]|uniref:hypothetical protein n=1 Tax=Burkholderia territorii TaxID=1503055 RepID=UPI00076D83CA|nr:hypothetical protein [Burkholderia territorii]KWO55948.1 hypothetical protein WT98_00035 [Burkholderia territorii]